MILAVRTHENELPEVIEGRATEYQYEITVIDRPWKIFQQNGNQSDRISN